MIRNFLEYILGPFAVTPVRIASVAFELCDDEELVSAVIFGILVASFVVWA